jgi:glycosylphosphatidylinositol phospholipase D
MKTSKELLFMAAAAIALPCQAGLPPAVYDLGSLGNTGATVSGPSLAGHAGTTLVGNCDFNGDGIADFAVGAPPGGSVGGGAVYVVYGTATGAPPPFSLDDADVTINGESDGDSLGNSLACGDVNGDGIDDLVIGAPAVTSAGYAYVIYGGLALPSTLDLTGLTAAQGMRIPGFVNNTALGWAAAVGDVNGDGIADLIVTAPGARSSSSNTGQGFVIFGTSTLPGTFDLSTLNGSNGFAISATDLQATTPAGDSVAIGDLNDDGFGDIAFGSRSAFPNGLSSAGEVWVVYGHAGAFAPELQVGNLNGANGFAIEPAHGGAFAGTSLAFVADFNGDGTPDLAIGAPATPAGPQFGTVFVIFGKGGNTFPAHFGLGTLDGANGIALVSPNLGDYAGTSVAGIADLNGDGVGEIAIGAPASDVGATDAGGGWVVYGRRIPWPATVSLATMDGGTGFYMQGAALSDAAGTAVASAGDSNRDGLHDVLISAPLADVNNTINVGRVYVLYGNDLIFADGFDGAP